MSENEKCCPPSVAVRECRPRLEEWNAFAARCRGSYLCRYEAAQQLGPLRRPTFIELYTERDGIQKKIGQAALQRRRDIMVFRDRIQLLPDAAVPLSVCLQAVMEHFGPGRYRYGSQWNWEALSPTLLDARSAAVVTQLNPCTIEAIDLKGWSGFEDYYRSVSSNIRRNDARCRQLGDEVRLRTLPGLAALWALPHLLRTRWHVMRHKVRRPWRLAFDMLEIVAQILLFRRSIVVMLGAYRGKVLSVILGIRHGDVLHYISGGTLPNKVGMGPHLFMHAVRYWYQHHPEGLFVMGISDGAPPERHASGHLLFRRKLRVMGQKTAVLGIEYWPQREAVTSLDARSTTA